MTTETKLGKIQDVFFGIGGYQDSCIGISFTLAGEGWGVNDSKSAWDVNRVKHSEYCKWTEEDRSHQYDEIMRYTSNLLKLAKVNKVEQLKGKPIQAIFNGNTLQEWRILTEVL